MSTQQVAAGPATRRFAVIGMAGRFPGAPDIDRLWGNLLDGVESLTELTEEQLRGSNVPEKRIANPRYVRLRPLMDDHEGFDAPYFRYLSREADIADPQHRILLEVSNSALENAGYDPRRYSGTVGVFAGSSPDRYLFSNVYENDAVRAAVGTMAIEVGNAPDYLATRVAYSLGLDGPAISLYTACSTSLVAIHSACQSLASGECDMALAGGVSLQFPYFTGQEWAEDSIYTRDGHVRVFDAEASGTNFGSGAGVVVLKRYEDAVADGDHIEAVAIGSAVNNDGAARTGFTAPGHDGQAAVITKALAAAGAHPDSIGYVEAHGTATALGDPTEVAALTSAYRRAGSAATQSIPIGSLKGNIGHLGPAAGVVGLIKATLAIRHGVIPPVINFSSPNPRIPFADSPFFVNTESVSWAGDGSPRRAAVSSFGIGGTNAHLIIEEPPAQELATGAGRLATGSYEVLPLSAASEDALAAVRGRLAERLGTDPAPELADVAHTLQEGRRPSRHRTAIVCRDTDEAVTLLSRPGGRAPVLARRDASVAFLFPGQGAQSLGMAAGTYASEPVFRDTVDECADLLVGHLGLDLRTYLCTRPEDSGASAEMSERLRQTELAQPALFVTEYALARLWESRGVTPAALVGHSVGEYAAAALAGVFSLPDALRLVALRGRLTQAMPPGAMLAVELPESDLAPLLTDELSLAAVNGPKACVVAGPDSEVELLEEWLGTQGVRRRRLVTSHAFHSAMLDPVVPEFRAVMAGTELHPPRIPMVSTLTGRPLDDDRATDPGYWADQLRGTVRFADACAAVHGPGVVLLEAGPGQTLTTLARQCLPSGAAVVPSLPRAGSERPESRTLTEAAGLLWCHGVDVDWAAVRGAGTRRRIALPEYPYERVRHWVEPDPDVSEELPAAPAEPAVLDAADATHLPVWRRRPLPPGPSSEALSGDGLWLVLTHGEGPAEELATALEGRGSRVVRAVPGDSFAALGENRFTIDPGSRADYDALLTSLRAGPGHPTAVLHGLTAGAASADPFSAEETERVRTNGFDSLLLLSQALSQAGPDLTVDIRVLTTGSSDVTGGDPVEPAKGLLLGPCRVIPHESPTLGFQLLDIDTATPGERLLDEVRTPVTDPLVAYRTGRRWVADHERVTLPEHTEIPRLLRRRGVYLVTGGLGGIGLETAKELARTVAARLVLVNRTALPERASWDAHLAEHGPGDEVSRRILSVREVEELGGEVLIAAADVADEKAMREVVDAARDRFGRFHGVFHAAGVPGGGLAALRTPEQAHAVFAPKVDGTLVLDRLLGDELEVMVLFSSIVSVSGDYGLVDYCSANAFLDTFAQARRGAGARHTVAVNWCGWTEVGMIGNTADAAPEIFRRLEQGLAPADETPTDHPLLGGRVDGSEDETTFTTVVTPDFHWVLAEHRMGGAAVFPGTSYIEMMCAAHWELTGPGPVELTDVLFSRPLAVQEPRELQVRARRTGAGTYEMTVRSRSVGVDEGRWQHHAMGVVAGHPEDDGPARRDLGALRKEYEHVWTPDSYQQPVALVGFGPHWPVIERFHLGDAGHLVSLRLPEGQDEDLGDFVVHPSLLDGATGLSMFLPEVIESGGSYLPVGYRRVVVRESLSGRLQSHVRPTGQGDDSAKATFDIGIMDENGREIVSVEEFTIHVFQADELVGTVDAAADAARAPEPAGRPVPAATSGGVTPGADSTDTGPAEQLIAPGEGLSLLWRVLAAQDENRYVISREPLAARADRIARMSVFIQSSGSSELAGRPQRREPSPAMGESPAEQATSTEKKLTELWQDAFGISRAGLDEDFFDLGGNSLVAVQLAVRIRDTFGVNVPGVAVLEYPTVRDLARRVDELLAETGSA
ncbi:type I polyketide synthase [Streptomyces sp. NBC_01716]|uniref:type I polyketide synthase n=1 Tax=Streptomyces sp. NBC_01716 TaxID=2975917 RepID=UPI002E2EC89A|nr:type I polyketide synthase [Streptomyces sp. NBC_01716]